MKSYTQPIEHVLVRAHAKENSTGTLSAGAFQVPCALGRSGIGIAKHEGDGVTPAGTWPMREVLFRPDRITGLKTRLPLTPIRPHDGWCDDPASPDYNRKVTLPNPASHEQLWRDDHLYDVIVVLGFNDAPVVHGAGSAIFFHLARPGFLPTEGCVAVHREAMIALLEHCGPETVMQIRM